MGVPTKIFYGVAETIEGLLDEGISKFTKRLENNKEFRDFVNAALKDAGEGIEGGLTDIVDQVLKAVYNKMGMGQNFVETEWNNVARDVLKNAIIGIFSGDSGN